MLKTKELSTVRNDAFLKNSLLLAGISLMSVVASKASILGYPSAVNVIMASVSDRWGVAVFVVSLLTYLVTGTFSDGLMQISSMVLIIGIKLALIHRSSKGKTPSLREAANALLVTGSMAACSALISAVSRTDPYLFAYRMVFSLLGGCIVYFTRALIASIKENGSVCINGFNAAFLGAVYIVCIATLTSVNILGADLGRIIGVAAILAMSVRYKHIGGAVCGALTTCGVMLCSPELAGNTLLLASCGLLCGAVSGLGQVFCALVMIFSSAVSLMAVGFNDDTFHMLADAAIGGIAFAAVPSEVTAKLFRYFGSRRVHSNIAGQTAAAKLKFASGTIRDVRTRLLGVSKVLREEYSKPPVISAAVREKVCAGCSVRGSCWEENRETLESAFEKIQNRTMENGSVSDEELDGMFHLCKREPQLAAGFNDCYMQLMAEQADRAKISELRELLSDQLLAMEEMLTDISDRLSGVTDVDRELSEKVKSYISKRGAANCEVCVYSDPSRIRKVEIFSPSEIKADMVRWTVEIGGMMDCELEMPVITSADGVYRLSFCESPLYSTESGASQFAARDGDPCGDTLERIWLTRSEFAVILSDGMGTGKRAKLDSSFASSLISRFLASEISPETALRLINAILRVKGWDESFATADIALFDLCSGNVRFIKAGAAPSYILRDEVLIRIDGQAFPVGILSETSPDSFVYKLFDGDRVILASDGISEDIIRSSAAELNRCSMDPQNASELIGEYARTGVGIPSPVRKRDDISVCVVDININK